MDSNNIQQPEIIKSEKEKTESVFCVSNTVSRYSTSLCCGAGVKQEQKQPHEQDQQITQFQKPKQKYECSIQ